VAHVLGRKSADEVGDWSLVIEEKQEDPPAPFVEEFLAVLDGHFDALAAIGVSRDDVTAWVLYEYDQQCNLEFTPEVMTRLGAVGISLCISCWQGPE
jgi:hypothetical protein